MSEPCCFMMPRTMMNFLTNIQLRGCLSLTFLCIITNSYNVLMGGYIFNAPTVFGWWGYNSMNYISYRME